MSAAGTVVTTSYGGTSNGFSLFSDAGCCALRMFVHTTAEMWMEGTAVGLACPRRLYTHTFSCLLCVP